MAYEWISNWAKIPETTGWAHSDMAVRENGEIISGHAETQDILFFDAEGNLLRQWPLDCIETHGFWISKEDGQEILWVADTGRKRDPEQNYEYSEDLDGKVYKCTMDGDVLATIDKSNISGYADDAYFSPTQITVNPVNGDLYIADGYGQNKVHCLTASFEWKFHIDGNDGAGAFDTPHAVFVDERKDENELYICDRMNDRIQVFTMDGEYKRCINPGLIMPSALASFGETLVVAELSARLVLLDINDQIIDLIGDGRADYVELEGWPNRLRDGCPVWPEDLVDGKFNSPHGLTADPSGNIYVFEWLIKGRYIKLQLK